ncbi:TetR/AcrR family transcriptional regulator [Agromyces mariniharenae]|uniref:TetR/AcrR family transcriptional regulator n=1 Tax=Agromyces mariniharenae TaxID=2604423 RepID=A0A5S4V5G2_9MICO|nr:TetR/AcrR family transcriptional regulator [Agromyces mariniharenae]TYL54367.1 TetR/AcrR family transcriptional regulator [Agromyces mariniharenae]
MPRVTEAYRTARRDEIIAAALRCFAEKGYQRTSMADIIEESGLSAGAIYGHFAGKQELFAAVAGRVLDARAGELEAMRGSGDPPSPGRIIATLLDGMRREPFSGVLLQLWAEAVIDPAIREQVQQVLGRLKATLHARLAEWAAVPGHVEGDPEAWAARAVPVVIGLGPGFIVQRALVDGFDEDAYLRALPELLPH